MWWTGGQKSSLILNVNLDNKGQLPSRPIIMTTETEPMTFGVPDSKYQSFLKLCKERSGKLRFKDMADLKDVEPVDLASVVIHLTEFTNLTARAPRSRIVMTINKERKHFNINLGGDEKDFIVSRYHVVNVVLAEEESTLTFGWKIGSKVVNELTLTTLDKIMITRVKIILAEMISDAISGIYDSGSSEQELDDSVESGPENPQSPTGPTTTSKVA